MTRYAIVDRDGRFWTGTWDGWSPFVEAAAVFEFMTDAILAAYQGCGADPQTYDTRPIAVSSVMSA
jgi:hypothetical protein